MDLWLTKNGPAGSKLLVDALARGPVSCIHLSPGRLQLAGLVIDRQIALVGDGQTCLVGPVRLGPQGKVRLTGLKIEGDIHTDGMAVLHLVDASMQGCLVLDGMSRTVIQRCLLEGDAAGVALAASGRAQALFSQCAISGGDVVATLGPHTQVKFDQTVTIGAVMNLGRDVPRPPARPRPRIGAG